jgi:Cys-tRNA(Pro)/Cys-tRNA(Cys) deacylase
MSTRAIQFLKHKGIRFEVLKYEHAEKGAEFAAQAVDFPLEKTIKTLLIQLGHDQYCLALMPGNKQLSLKHIAKAFAVKRAAMADTATAQRLTGYLVGGISPFGSKQHLPAVIDASLLQTDSVIINGGQRGVLLEMQINDIITLLDCRIATIAQE